MGTTHLEEIILFSCSGHYVNSGGSNSFLTKSFLWDTLVVVVVVAVAVVVATGNGYGGSIGACN